MAVLLVSSLMFAGTELRCRSDSSRWLAIVGASVTELKRPSVMRFLKANWPSLCRTAEGKSWELSWVCAELHCARL